MPTATPFTFFGNQTLVSGVPSLSAGVLFNGFPFFTDKVDVSGFDYWITLGGTEKGNTPSPSEIDLSWDNAVKLYWNLYGINYTDENGTQLSIDVDNDLIAGSAEPKDRAIYPSGSIEIGNGFLGDQVRLKFRNGNDAGVDYSPIVALYDSDTFLGYGLDFPESKDQILAGNQEPSFGDFPILYDTLATAGSQFLGFCSYAPTLNSYTGGGSYVEISNIPLIKTVAGSVPAGLSAITIDSLEFYTYP